MQSTPVPCRGTEFEMVLGVAKFCCGSKAVNDARSSGVNPPGSPALLANIN